MAGDFEFHVNARVEWKTKLYHRSELVSSPTFSLLGSEWCLVYSCQDEGFFGGCSYSAYLFPKGGGGKKQPLETPFEVAAYVRHPTDPSRVPSDWTRRRVTQREDVCIWDREMSGDDIFDDLHCIRDLGEVWLVCAFYGAEPSAVDKDKVSSDIPGNLRPVRIEEKSVQATSEVPRDVESLSDDLSFLLSQKILPDVKLECGGGRKFHAHRSVLAARSEVFRVMFRNETTLESRTGTVRIPDTDPAVLERLLQFVYTGRPADISDGKAADLYEAADKYAVTSLKEACSYWIGRNLTAENCVEYLVVADSHCDRHLKEAVVTFIVENPRVLRERAWMELAKEPSKLTGEVFQAYVASTVQ